MKRQFRMNTLVPAFFMGSPAAWLLGGALFQFGVLSAGIALLVAPVITTLAMLVVLNRL